MYKRLFWAGVTVLAFSIIFGFSLRDGAEELFGVNVNKLSFAEGEALIITVTNESFSEVTTGYGYQIMVYEEGE